MTKSSQFFTDSRILACRQLIEESGLLNTGSSRSTPPISNIYKNIWQFLGPSKSILPPPDTKKKQQVAAIPKEW